MSLHTIHSSKTSLQQMPPAPAAASSTRVRHGQQASTLSPSSADSFSFSSICNKIVNFIKSMWNWIWNCGKQEPSSSPLATTGDSTPQQVPSSGKVETVHSSQVSDDDSIQADILYRNVVLEGEEKALWKGK